MFLCCEYKKNYAPAEIGEPKNRYEYQRKKTEALLIFMMVTPYIFQQRRLNITHAFPLMMAMISQNLFL